MTCLVMHALSDGFRHSEFTEMLDKFGSFVDFRRNSYFIVPCQNMDLKWLITCFGI
jgi:hypothetical protein